MIILVAKLVQVSLVGGWRDCIAAGHVLSLPGMIFECRTRSKSRTQLMWKKKGRRKKEE